MAHAIRLHNNSFGNALEKRMPYPTPEPVPDPGLVGDLLDGVGDVVNNAVSGVVGLVTTVLGDVNKLVVPARTSATAAASGTSAPSAPSASSAPSTPQATTASPSATSTPTSGGGNSGSGGGSSGSNGNSGGSNGSNSNGNTPSNGNGSTNGSTSNNGSSSNSDSGSSDSDSPSSNPSSSSVSNASGISSASGDTNDLESSAIPGPMLSASASVSLSDVVNLAQSSATLSGTAATAAPVINAVGSVESEDRSDSTLLSGARGTATTRNTLHTSLPTGTSGSGSGSGSGSNGDVNGNSAASSKHGLSPGIIAAIAVISSLAFLVLIVFVTRRWYRKRRERRFENWVSRPGAFAFFGAASANINNENDEKSEGAASGSGTRSARSSFGTTIDRGLRPFTPDPFGQSASNFSDFYSATNTSMTFLAPSPVPAPLVATPPVQRPESAVNRQSLISLASSSSSSYESGGGSGPNNTSTEAVAADRDGSADDHAQYLIVAASQSQNSPNAPQPSPISVRPWSPSERWAFPKPPSSTSALGNIFYQPSASPVSQPVESDRMPASNLPPLAPVTPETTNPFADSSQIPDEVTSGTCESAKTSLSGTDGVVGAVEHIRRPFLPTLADELRVQRGDIIRVLQVFDDGWVQVEKISGTIETSGAETTTSVNERGLIPVDCLREADEPLPDFLASRRVSSYYGYGVAM